MKKYKLAVVIGRHQISHKGHELLKQGALALADQVLILIGSSFQSRNTRNPFTWQEREAMILSSLTEQQCAYTVCKPIRDYYNEARWNVEVKRIVNQYSQDNIVLVGHKKQHDTDTYYLDNFPNWEYQGIESAIHIDASELRAVYFSAENMNISLAAISDWLLPQVKQFLKAWSIRADYQVLAEEYKKIEQEKALWDGSPYPVIFSTTDALVRVNNHVLLGKRKYHPGKGLWAIPGGFLEKDERVLIGALRELKEETQIGLLDSSLLNDFKAVKVFDHPKRSCRGRVITHVHFFDLNCKHFPEVKAADDFQEVAWVAIKDLLMMEEQLFEDHFHILDAFLILNKSIEC